MSFRSITMRLALRALAALHLVAIAACARGAQPSTATEQSTAAAGEERFAVYDLAPSWRDQYGAARPIASLAGRPVVMAMIYTHCNATCPLILGEMKRIEHADPGVALVLVSLDPDRDTPGRLAEYASSEGLSDRWTLLSGSDDDTRALAATLGIRYRRISAEELAHSNTLTLLDATGTIVHQEMGLGAGEAILRASRALPNRSNS
ncbi:MAG: SCO family protein [Gemmatimonadaceae bacterium]|nr:SCO family protein [Gemmatimonadaceae bacterium]NUQ91985.1 SCO family protein [Gemmatimonadaceae bacterium]NUR20702.1 SCO family protein [Gemmatimonadaceae bacterium]NUS98463.1 SCO family protein [Gemmatimonadaceae bacterium]